MKTLLLRELVRRHSIGSWILVIQLLRGVNPEGLNFIGKNHKIILQNLVVTGVGLNERAAVHIAAFREDEWCYADEDYFARWMQREEIVMHPLVY